MLSDEHFNAVIGEIKSLNVQLNKWILLGNATGMVLTLSALANISGQVVIPLAAVVAWLYFAGLVISYIAIAADGAASVSFLQSLETQDEKKEIHQISVMRKTRQFANFLFGAAGMCFLIATSLVIVGLT